MLDHTKVGVAVRLHIQDRKTKFRRCNMKSFSSVHSLALLCCLLPALGSAPPARAALPVAHLVSPHGVRPALETPVLKSVKATVLQRTARAAVFQTDALQKVLDMEEPSWLLVLGTCLLGSAAALFRKMKA
jgi:hypothetical protein